ncbi:MAG: ABC transporter permease [Anaerolineae bacterium]|nr:ABC transporter permease [Anaerolineae bacterium]
MTILTSLRRWVALVRTEFQNEFSSPISLVFYVLLPLLFTFAVGAGLGGMMGPSDDPVEEVTIPIYVQTSDTGDLVDALLGALEEANLAPERVEAIPAESYGLAIPADFSETLLAGGTPTVVLHTLPNNSASPAVEQALMAARGRVGGAALVADMGVEQARKADVVTTEAEAQGFFVEVLEATLAATADPPAIPEVRWPEGVRIAESRDFATGAEQASAGQIVTWVQITLLGAAEALVAERLNGTLRRMLVMPARRGTILGGKLVARLLLGLVQMALLLGVGALLFDVGWDRQPLAVAAVSFAFALATVSLGTLLATAVSTQGQASSVVVGMSMAMAALGGAWFPLEITPPLYRQVVQVLPSTWAMRAYTDILVRGAGLVAVLPHVGILLGFSILLMGLGVWRFSRYE